MNSELQGARDDLAYLRALVDGGGRFQASAGRVFLWAGLLYGAQCIGNFLAIIGVISLSPLGYVVLGVVPTLAFLAVLGVVIWNGRKERQPSGVATRAIAAVFQAAGLANLVLALVFAYGATKAQSLMVWLYHPVVVCMIQGVAWYVAWAIRKQVWLAFVSAGWFSTTIACGLLIDRPGAFLLVLGVALIVCMALPGYVMMRAAKPAV